MIDKEKQLEIEREKERAKEREKEKERLREASQKRLQRAATLDHDRVRTPPQSHAHPITYLRSHFKL